ncbi:MAG: glycogen-binding domain-containing protein [Deltaproteobacteria bacterium]
MIRRAIAIASALAASAAPATAQFTAALDLGAGTAHSDDAFSGAVASLAPSLAFESGALRLNAAGAYSNGPSGRWNFQGTAGGTLTSRRFGPVALEGNGSLAWTWHQLAQATTTLEGGVRAWAYPSAAIAVWAGGSLGSAYSLGTWRPLRRSQVGTAAHLGPVRLALSLTSTAFDIATDPGTTPTGDTLGVGGPFGGVRRNTFTDGMISGRLTLATLDVELGLGRRFSRTTPEVTLWSATVSRSLTPDLALVAGAGRSATDPVTALPGARYLVLGMRVSVRPPGSTRPAEPLGRPDAGNLRIGPPAEGGREIELRAPRARVVELAGDFTDWLPLKLERGANGEWRIRVALAPGVHRVVMRVDGGAWRPPPGTRRVESEFGPEVGEIVVE